MQTAASHRPKDSGFSPGAAGVPVSVSPGAEADEAAGGSSGPAC